jgi:putative Mg2+ transporter-C (MgtC) family protein
MDSLGVMLSGYWTDSAVAANVTAFLNILGALLLGLLVGYERSYRGRAAGMRTYGLVCMSACALTVISGYPEFWFGGHFRNLTNLDPGRIIQGIVTGIGFLGAGVIMRDGLNISGLTTAASIWSVASIGVLTGMGFYAAATLLAVISTVLMMWGSKIEFLLPARHAIAVTLHFRKSFMPSEEKMQQLIHKVGYELAKGSFAIASRSEQHEWRFVVVSLGKEKGGSLINLSRALSGAEGVESFLLSHARN